LELLLPLSLKQKIKLKKKMEKNEQHESFVFNKSFYELIDGLPEENQLELLKSICEYSLYGNEIQMTGLTKNTFVLIKPQLDANITKYQMKIEKKKNERTII
jgi:hypothetical protein